MDRHLRVMAEIARREPELLVHAPFTETRNITPFADLAARPYDLAQAAGRHAALFGGRDKVETQYLFAALAKLPVAGLTMCWEHGHGGGALIKMLQLLGWQALTEKKARATFAHIETIAPHDLLDHWLEHGGPRIVPGTSLAAHAGLFSWREIDPASALLVSRLPQDLSGLIGDFGCGWGYLSDFVLRHCPKVERLRAIDNDSRAVEQTKRNIADPRLDTMWADITTLHSPVSFDAIVMNPPFHDDRGRHKPHLGTEFIETAVKALKPGGALYMVANRHLPYEKTLRSAFAATSVLADEKGFKVIKAVKGD